MTLFKWDNKFSVNDEELDNHHKALFDILNRLYQSCFEDTVIIALDPIYEELISYIDYHFSAEEQHMRNIGYVNIDTHIIAHNLFKEKILQLRHNVDIDNIEVTKQLIVYLGKWLLNHVLAEDRKYSI